MARPSKQKRIGLSATLSVSLLLSACSVQTTDSLATVESNPIRPISQPVDASPFHIRVREHVDLVSAGLSLAGLRRATPQPVEPEAPTAGELRAMAFHTQFNSLAAVTTDDGLGRFVEIGLPEIAGVEIMTLRRIPGQTHSARVLLQIPETFDTHRPCLVVAPASGSRGVYGAIPLAAPWALPRGCAVVYSDKAAGTDYFDHASQTGVQLNGQRVALGESALAFVPEQATTIGPQVATPHAHSQINVEVFWGEITLDATRWALAQLETRFEGLLGDRVTVIATGLSNGGNAVLRALEADRAGLIDAAVAIMPNITPPNAAHLYEYAATAALYQPCLLGDTEFTIGLPFGNPLLIAAGRSRCQSLFAAGLLEDANPDAARRVLDEFGFDQDSLAFSAAIVTLDVWRIVLANYASAYLKAPANAMPCGFRFEAPEATPAQKRAWWATASGSPPGNGVVLVDSMTDEHPTDPHFAGLRCLHELRSDSRLQAAVAATRAQARWTRDIPVFIVHGQHDALIPAVFSSRAYVDQARANGMSIDYAEIEGAQHFDAFLNVLPGEHDWVPILPHGWAALDRAWTALGRDTSERQARSGSSLNATTALSAEYR